MGSMENKALDAEQLEKVKNSTETGSDANESNNSGENAGQSKAVGSFQEMIDAERFSLQRKHVYVHTVLLVASLCYFAHLVSIKYAVSVMNIIGIAVVVLAHVTDFLLSRKKYSENAGMLIFAKAFMIIATLFFGATFANDVVLTITSFAIAVLHFTEYIECVDFSSEEVKEHAAFFAIVSFSTVFIIVALVGTVKISMIQVFFLIAIGCVALYSIVGVLHYCFDRYVNYITKLNYDNSELTSLNDRLQDQSRKIKEANVLLGVQKIELSKANDVIQLQNTEMALQNEILGIVSAEKDMQSILMQIGEVLLRQENIDGIGIFIDALMYGNQHPMKYTRVPNIESLESVLQERAEDVLFKVHHFDEDFRIYNSSLPDRYADLQDSGIRSLLEVQINVEGGMCGVLVIASNILSFFNEDTDFYVSVAKQIGIAVNNANLYSTMENLATRDGLTGIYNRRHFNKLFNDYVSTAMDLRQPIAAALFDIDKFKNVNDTYGHSFGDLVIVTVSRIANEIVEKNGGIFGRYGGEEFIMAFLDKDTEAVMPIVEEIHEKIKSAELVHNGEIVKINVSIGVTDYPKLCSNPADLLNHADWAMYYSKQHGRGRITIDSEEVRAESQIK